MHIYLFELFIRKFHKLIKWIRTNNNAANFFTVEPAIKLRHTCLLKEKVLIPQA